MRKWILLALTAAAISAAGANCTPPSSNTGPREAALRGFGSAEEMRAFLAEQAKAPYQNQAGGGGLFGWFLGAAPSMAPTVDMAADTSGGAQAEGGDDRGYSTTNVQEAGVDESDIVKNDGSYIYMLTSDKVHVVKAVPVNEMAEVATIEVESGGDSLYLRPGQLIALSTTGWCCWSGGAWPEPAVAEATAGEPAQAEAAWDEADADDPPAKVVNARISADALDSPWYDGNKTTVSVIDVNDPANPVAVKTIQFEGNLASSRLIGDRLHVVMTTMPRLPQADSAASIDAMTLDEWLPDVAVMSSDGQTAVADAVDWQTSFRPADPNGYAMTLVATINLTDLEAPIATTAVTANVETVYASLESLYLTDTEYSYSSFSMQTDTVLHKLTFTDAGTDYVASGLVPGRPLNQYSLGEYQGYLRIGTTGEGWGPDTSQNASGVYVLGENGGTLDIVGKVENIAPGERIYSARFLGDRGFLVTFRRIDPLFTVDLSDPTSPTILGELKVPGYSDHIQFLDENHLLTIGRNAEESDSFAWVQGVLLTIFDVTDMANPQILDVNGSPARVEIGGRGTYSEANHNPKAFNHFAERNALAFPIDLYDGDTTGAEYGTYAFTGLYVYRVTVENGFEYLGRIASSENAGGNGCYDKYYGPTRGVFIGEHVYSVTGLGVKAATIADVGTIAGEADFADGDGLSEYCQWTFPELMLPPSDDLR